MSMHFRKIAEHASVDGIITAEEILALRGAGWADGKINPDEAEALFMINDKLADPTTEWSDFFAIALREFIVNTQEPKGYVTEEQADWLMARIDHNGHVESLTELEMLVQVFERAQSVPVRLREYALGQVEHAVLEGEGPTRCGGTLEKGNVTAAEAGIMRRIIFASGSARPAAVSRTEADMLYRIKDAALGAENAPEWKRLFVQGVGNYIAGFVDHTAMTRERAAELEGFMNDHKVSLGGFFGKMAKSTVSGNFFDTIGDAIGNKDEGPGIASRADDARGVDTNEQMWLEGKIDSNGKVDAYDQAVLDFLEEESGFNR